MRIPSRLARLVTALIVAAALIVGAPPLSASADSDATVTGHVSLGSPEASHVAGDVKITFDSSFGGGTTTTVYTDASGNYSVQLAAQYYEIKYSYVGSAGYYQDAWYGGQPTLWLVQSGSQVFNINLSTVVPVSGSVFLGDAATSAGSTGVISWYHYEWNSWYYKTTYVHTAADGSFTTYLVPGLYKFVFATSTAGYQQWYGDAFDVVSAPVTGVNGVIPPKGQVSGHITVGARSANAGEVTVGIESCHGWFCDYPTITPVVTDASGNYSFPNLWDGGYKLTFTYSDNTYQTYKTSQFELDDTLRVRVVDHAMLPSRALGGTVYLGDSSVKAGAGEVSVKIKKDGYVVATVLTDADGHYGATGLADGSYTLSFSYLGTSLIRGLDYPLTLSADNLAADVTLPKQNTVSGTVVDIDGNPIQGVGVVLDGYPLGGGMGVWLTATTDANGDYKLSNVPDGNYTATFNAGGYASQKWPYESTYEGENIRLSSSGIVDIDAELYEEGTIAVDLDTPSFAASDYSSGYVGAYLFWYDFDIDEWRQVDNRGFANATSVVNFPQLAFGYYTVVVSYDGPQGYVEDVSDPILILPGISESFSGRIRLAASETESFVMASYYDVLGRAPDSAGLVYWIAALNRGVPRSSIAAGFTNSDEFRLIKINAAYEEVLGRLGSGDPEGVLFWLNGMRRGLVQPDDVHRVFLSSNEFYQVQGGGTDTGYVTALYLDQVGRAPDADGLAFWLGVLHAHGRGAVVDGLWFAPETFSVRVTDAYDDLLGRAPDASGLAFWAGVARSIGITGMRTQIMSSQEYWNRAAARF